jgi:hypothetical protein
MLDLVGWPLGFGEDCPHLGTGVTLEKGISNEKAQLAHRKTPIPVCLGDARE